jgi:hypothetical protein
MTIFGNLMRLSLHSLQERLFIKYLALQNYRQLRAATETLETGWHEKKRTAK